jgi:hypothetical protein
MPDPGQYPPHPDDARTSVFAAYNVRWDEQACRFRHVVDIQADSLAASRAKDAQLRAWVHERLTPEKVAADALATRERMLEGQARRAVGGLADQLRAVPADVRQAFAGHATAKAAPRNANEANSADVVNNPAHYTAGDIECIDAIKAALTPEEFRGFCKGNVIKYAWRERLKGGVESLRKAAWYLARIS